MKRQFWIWTLVCAALLAGCRQEDADTTNQTDTPVVDAAVQTAVQTANTYIVDSQNADGGWPLLPGEESDAETTAFAVWALAEGGTDAHAAAVQSGEAYLKAAQREDGSWNGNTAHTVFTLIALNAVDKSESGARAKAVIWLESAQNADGSWPRETGGEGNLIYTSAVLCGLQKIGYKKESPPIARGAKWVLDRPAGDGGWAVQPGSLSDNFATAWAAQALYRVEEIPTQMEWLRCAQNVDGGFGPQKGKMSDPEITAAAAAALSLQEWPLVDQQYALNYLIYIQQKNGSFISAVPIELSEPKQNIQTSCFALIAIQTLIAAGARLP